MQIDTIITDLDGTLLDENSRISPGTLSVLRECMQAGIRIIFNSGRTKASMQPYVRLLGAGQPYAGGNGTEIMSPEGDYLYRSQIETETVRKVCTILEEMHLYAQIYDDECFYYGHGEGCAESEKYRISSNMKSIPVGKLSEYVSSPSSKIVAINLPEKNEQAHKILADRFGSSLDFTSSNPYLLEIIPIGNSKADAVRRMMEMFRWDPNRVLTCGDSHNDVSMLQAVPHSVAMANACAEAKASARYICGNHQEDGLARFIKEHVLSHKEVSV